MARSLVTIAAALLVSVAVTPAHSQARSTAFERFVFSFFEDSDSAREGLDTEALGRLVGEERRRAGDMLINALPDSRAIIGLGVLRSQRAEPNLLRLFEAERLAQRHSKLLPDLGWSPYKLLHLVKALSLGFGQTRVGPPLPSMCSAPRMIATNGKRLPRLYMKLEIPLRFGRSRQHSTTPSPWSATMRRADC